MPSLTIAYLVLPSAYLVLPCHAWSYHSIPGLTIPYHTFAGAHRSSCLTLNWCYLRSITTTHRSTLHRIYIAPIRGLVSSRMAVCDEVRMMSSWFRTLNVETSFIFRHSTFESSTFKNSTIQTSISKTCIVLFRYLV